MTRRLAAALLTISSVVLAGCIDLEQTLTLDRNMSGQAGFAMKFDLEGMARMMAQMKRAMEGKEGAPTQAEIDEVAKELQTSGTSTSSGDFEKQKAELATSLPAGVKLLGASFEETGLRIAANMSFGFDHVSKLKDISLPKKQAAGPAPGSPVDDPFGGLQVTDEGQTVLITSPVENPAGDSQSQMPPGADPETMKQVEEMLKGLRVAFKITSPLEIVEHNAHRKEGTTLIWEYDVKALQKLSPDQLKQGVRVRYRK
jgi:hypothetical protein